MKARTRVNHDTLPYKHRACALRGDNLHLTAVPLPSGKSSVATIRLQHRLRMCEKMLCRLRNEKRNTNNEQPNCQLWAKPFLYCHKIRLMIWSTRIVQRIGVTIIIMSRNTVLSTIVASSLIAVTFIVLTHTLVPTTGHLREFGQLCAHLQLFIDTLEHSVTASWQNIALSALVSSSTRF